MIRAFAHLASLAALLLVTTACGAADDSESGPGPEVSRSAAARGLMVEIYGRRLRHDGISVGVPNGWEGRELLLDHPSAVLQVANFDFGPVGEQLPPGEEDPIKAMASRHALVAILPCGLVSYEEPPRPAPSRLSLDDLILLPKGHPRIPVGHTFASGSFDFSGRCLRVEADFGGAPPPRRLTDTVDLILASLSVERRR